MSQVAAFNKALAVTPSDSVNFGPYHTDRRLTDALYVGGAGIVVAVFENDATANFTCAAGQLLPLAVKRVNAASTTATLIVALYQV